MAPDAHSVECDALVVDSHDQPRQPLDRGCYFFIVRFMLLILWFNQFTVRHPWKFLFKWEIVLKLFFKSSNKEWWQLFHANTFTPATDFVYSFMAVYKPVRVFERILRILLQKLIETEFLPFFKRYEKYFLWASKYEFVFAMNVVNYYF